VTAAHLLGRHVPRRAEHRSACGQRCVAAASGDAEVDQDRREVLTDEDVRWLDVAVEHALFVCGAESGRDIREPCDDGAQVALVGPAVGEQRV